MKDGGPAFPSHTEHDPNGQLVNHGTYGMSLRDYFAGEALAVIAPAFTSIQNCKLMFAKPESIARNAYAIADAMLKAREEQQ